MRDDRERLLDVAEAIKRIVRHTQFGREAFEDSELIQVWVIHHIQTIGEAARAVSDELKAAHPEVPWAEIIAMRHILVHQYFGIDREAVWSVVQRDLESLREQIERILSELEKR